MTRAKSPLRLRVPASLAVVVLGASATMTASFVGCQENVPEPVDAGRLEMTRDAAFEDGGLDNFDANLPLDAGDDPETPLPPDAGPPPH